MQGNHRTYSIRLILIKGVGSVKSAFYSLPKVFKSSEVVKVISTNFTINHSNSSKANPDSSKPNLIVIDMTTNYQMKWFDKTKTINSVVYLFLNNGKIVRHEELWDNKRNQNREDSPVVGRMKEVISVIKNSNLIIQLVCKIIYGSFNTPPR